MSLTTKQAKKLSKEAARFVEEEKLFKLRTTRAIAQTKALEAETKRLRALAKARKAKQEANALKFAGVTAVVSSGKALLKMLGGNNKKTHKRKTQRKSKK